MKVLSWLLSLWALLFGSSPPAPRPRTERTAEELHAKASAEGRAAYIRYSEIDKGVRAYKAIPGGPVDMNDGAAYAAYLADYRRRMAAPAAAR